MDMFGISIYQNSMGRTNKTFGMYSLILGDIKISEKKFIHKHMLQNFLPALKLLYNGIVFWCICFVFLLSLASMNE